MLIPGHITRTALVALAVSAFVLAFCPAELQAQQTLSAGDSDYYVGKWDFDEPGTFGGWTPLQAGTFEIRDGLVHVNAKSMRPCLDLTGPYSAEQIASIEIRIRGVEAQEKTPSGTAGNPMGGGGGNRTRIRPELYKGTRIYFTRAANEKYDAENSLEVPLPLDGKFHVLTIEPHRHASWNGMLQKIRFDLGDFPHHYELDYIHFHRSKKGRVKTKSTESEK